MIRLDFGAIIEVIKTFGFPIAVACWALYKLEKNWGKGENIKASLDNIEESLDKIEVILNKNAEIQNELVVSIKIMQTMLNQRGEKGR